MADLVRNGKKKRTVRRALYGPGAFLIACAALIFLMSIFFRVSSVEVRGNSYYTAEEVEDASGSVYNPLSEEQVRGKVTALIRETCGAQAEEIVLTELIYQ